MWTDGRTDMSKLIATFRNFVKGPKLFNVTNKYDFRISMFHRAFFNSIIDKTPTHALVHFKYSVFIF